MTVDPLVTDSVTLLPPEAAGRVVVAGSHGGVYSARLALAAGVAAILLNDAGIGLDEAGVAGLVLLQRAGVPGACIGHGSARIGDGADMLARGRISRLNDDAARLGLREGMTAEDAVGGFAAAELVIPSAIGQDADALPFRDGPLRVYDSASEVEAADFGTIVITGSHGGLPGPSDAAAIKTEVRIAAFNDAGVGIDEAGISRLPALDRRGIAGVTVDAFTARIGEGRSTLETGIISRSNRAASALGAKIGKPLADLVSRLVDTEERSHDA